MAASGPKGMAAETKITQSILDALSRHQWQTGLRNEGAGRDRKPQEAIDESRQRLDSKPPKWTSSAAAMSFLRAS
jgi:DNA-directed RNA polymerase subunit beta